MLLYTKTEDLTGSNSSCYSIKNPLECGHSTSKGFFIMNDSTYFIIYPRGDTTRLRVIELCYSSLYELDDYSVASRREFTDPFEAHKYAKELAVKNNITYEVNADVVGKSALYLD